MVTDSTAAQRGAENLLLRQRPTTVQAKRITADSRDDVLDWMKADVSAWPYGLTGITWWQDGEIHNAVLGEWVVLNPWGEYRRVSDAALFARYESVVAGVHE